MNLKAELVASEIEIHNIFESIYTTIISKLQDFLGRGSGRTIDSVIDHIINVSKYKHLAGKRFVKFLKELDHRKMV